MTSLTSETRRESAPKDTSPPPVSDSGVSNGSSLCLSESGVPISSEQAMEPITTTSASRDVLAQNTLFVNVEDSLEKGLSCLSLEVCASGDNLNMLSQDELSGSGCGSGPGSVEGLCMDGEEGVGLGATAYGGRVPMVVLDGEEEEIMALQSGQIVETCVDTGEGMNTDVHL